MKSRKTMLLFRRQLAAALAVTAPMVGGLGLTLKVALPAFAAPPTLGETAAKSRLGGFFQYFELPDGGRRVNDAELKEELTERLTEYAEKAKIPLYGAEIVAYDSSEEGVYTMLESTCLGAGLNYKEEGDYFTVRATGGDKSAAVGFWTERDGYKILVWGGGAPKPAKKPASSDDDTATREEVLPDNDGGAKPAPSPVKGDGKKIAPPASIVGGTWSWTTISSVNYVDKTTGRLQSPSGMSVKFSFRADGGYEFFFYMRQQTYSLVTEATTTEKGKATFYDNGTVIMHATTGHYKGNTGSRLIDRPMTDAERNKPRTYYWQWRTENGKKELYIGPSRSAMNLFKRQ